MSQCQESMSDLSGKCKFSTAQSSRFINENAFCRTATFLDSTKCEMKLRCYAFAYKLFSIISCHSCHVLLFFLLCSNSIRCMLLVPVLILLCFIIGRNIFRCSEDYIVCNPNYLLNTTSPISAWICTYECITHSKFFQVMFYKGDYGTNLIFHHP